MRKKDRRNIGVLTFPIGRAGNPPLSNLIDVLRSLSNNVYLITGNDGYAYFKEISEIRTYGVSHRKGRNPFTRIVNYVWTQLKISYMLAKKSGNVDFWVFFIGGEGLLLPMLTSKLFGKKVVLVLAGFPVRSAEYQKNALTNLLGILERISLLFSNKIIVYSENIARERRLEEYQSKLSVAHKHFLDFNSLKLKKKIEDRGNLVGYIGRLDEEKGVLNFIEAIPIVVGTRRDIGFIVGGDGDLSSRIEDFLREKMIENKVRMMGWIPHENVQDCLNELKLLVVPSYTEGLSNIMLEAMACGTPVLATPVGAVPDIIVNGKNGFLLENNSAECIAKNILEILDRKDLSEISENGRRTVEKNFTYEIAVKRYKEILESI